jgi:hypothetical protein
MDSQGFRDLVGRVMIDPDFLDELVRDPAAALAAYALSDEERATVVQALGRVRQAPAADRARTAKAVLMKRWAM